MIQESKLTSQTKRTPTFPRSTTLRRDLPTENGGRGLLTLIREDVPFKETTRPYVAFGLLWLLVLAYLPMMYYTKASYLTGAFLAGLSFSQVEGVHHTFVSEAGPIMEWLLRIFFSASIGFQGE